MFFEVKELVLGVLVLGVGSVTRDSVTVKSGGGVCVVLFLL